MYYVIVIVSVFVASVAQMLLKKGAMVKHTSFIFEYINPWVIGGYALMGLSLLANIFAMSKGVQVNEKITLRKIVSILIILIGIFIFFI